MTAAECLAAAHAAGEHYQRPINEFVDEFRRSTRRLRREMITAPVPPSGEIEGLVAAVVSALCRECRMRPPAWVAETASPTPFFAFPARSLGLRVRLMLESPPPFKVRNVYVPEDYLSRA